MKSFFYIMSLVSMGFPMPTWAIPMGPKVELTESNPTQKVEVSDDHQVEVELDRPELLNGQRLVIALQNEESHLNPKLLSSFSLNMITVEQKNESGKKTTLMVHMGVPTSVIGKILTTSIQHLELHSDGIHFDLPDLADLKDQLMAKIELVQQKRIYSDEVIFSGEMEVGARSSVSGESLKVNIPASELSSQSLASKKFQLKVSVYLKAPKLNILNSEDLSPIFERRIEENLYGAYAY